MYAIMTETNQGHLIWINFLQTAGSFHCCMPAIAYCEWSKHDIDFSTAV